MLKRGRKPRTDKVKPNIATITKSEYEKALSDYDKYGEYLEDAIEDGSESDIKKYKKLMDDTESVIHKYERKEEYAEGGWLKDHNYVNKKEAYEVRYSKDKNNRTGYKKFEGGGEIEAKISKLQKLVDSTLIPQSAKDKAKSEIEILKKKLYADSELKKSETYQNEGKDVYGSPFYQWHNISFEGDEAVYAYSTPKGTVIYGEDVSGEKDFITSFTTEPYYLEDAPQEDYSFPTLQESKIKAFELLRKKKLGKFSKQLQESKSEEKSDSDIKKHIDSLKLSKFVQDASYILSADEEKIEYRSEDKEGRDKITKQVIEAINSADEKTRNIYLEELGFKSKKTKSEEKAEEKEDLKHTYSMLDRLKEDNEYFLGNGNREESTLWAGNVKDQIAEMKKLWNELPKDGKPEWLSMAEIEEYEAKMTKSAEPSILKTDKGFIDETKAEIFKDKMVTYYFKSEFGMGISKIEGKLLKIGFEKYAQYNQSFFINLIPKGKRNGLKFRQNYNPFAIVLAGVGHPSPDDYLESVSEDKDVKISKSRHSSFSSEWAKEFNSKINDYLETHKEDIIADVRENREISSKSKEAPFKASEKFEIESTNSNYKKLKKQFPVISTSEALGLHMTGGSDDFEHVQKRSKELFNIELKKIDVINNPNGHGKVVLFKIEPTLSKPKEVKKVSHKDVLAKVKAKKGKGNNNRGDLVNYKTGDDKRRTRSVSSDKKREAKPLGRRVSESGNVYYENRLNRGDLDKGDKFKTGGEIMKKGKEISFEKSNLYLVGKGHDTNGNAVVKVKYPNSGTFSIQTLGNLPKTKSILNGVSNLAELTAEDLERMEKEIVSYIESFGTPTQKKGLKTYFAKGGEIESNPFKTKRGCW